MDAEDLSPQSFQTGSLGIFAALQETGADPSLINEADSRSLYNEHNASKTPSLAQQAALRVLSQLSSHQVAALIELKDCPSSLVEVWLRDAHRLGTFSFALSSLELTGRCSQSQYSTSSSRG